MRLFLILLLTITTAKSFAAISITGISGASNSTLASTGTSAILYGGMAGGITDSTCQTNGSGSTCDGCNTTNFPPSCTTAPLCACNSRHIYDQGVVRVSIKREATNAGEVRIQATTGSSTIVLPKPTTGGDYVDVKWTDLCGGGGGPISCSSLTASLTYTAKVFVDKSPGNGTLDSGEETVDLQVKIIRVPTDGTADVWGVTGGTSDGVGGTQGFTPYPGDEKVKIEDPEVAGNFPTLTYGGKVAAMRVYHSSAGLTALDTNAADPTDLTFSSDGKKLNSDIVSNGLDNDVTYVFRIGMLDEANNLVQIFPANDGTHPECDSAPDFDNCPWAATPEKVLGLLEKDVNCFIATAAYGSALEPKLDTFRMFRHKYLLQKGWGRKFVYWYYKYGPMVARYIYDKPVLRAAARGALWPVYYFSAASNKFGLFRTFVASLVFLGFSVGIGSLALRRSFDQT